MVAVFYYPVILQGKVPIPADTLVGLYHPFRDLYRDTNPRGIPFKNFLITDPVRQQIPWRKIVMDQWKQGNIPLWNPLTFSGNPLLGNIQSAALYPLNLLFLFVPFVDAWTTLIVLQTLLGGLFMYWYLRTLSLKAEASALGAIVWCFGGFMVAWLTWGTIDHVALWLPVAILAIDKIVRQQNNALSYKTVFWPLIFVFAMVSQFFAGHAQISLYFFLIVCSYITFRKAWTARTVFLIGFIALITAIQWIPLIEWTSQSSRILEASDWHAEGWFIPWQNLAQFIAPDFFGNPATGNYWGQWNYAEFIGYIGLLPLIFALSAIALKKSNVMVFWAMTAAVAFLFALPTPVAYLPFIFKIPILSSLQPTRLLFVIDFAFAVLAAYGFHGAVEHGMKFRARTVIVMIGFILAGLWSIAKVRQLDVSARNLVLPTALYVAASALIFLHTRKFSVRIVRNIVTWSIVGLTVADLLRFGWKFTPFTPREYFFPETKVIAFLKQQQRPFRVMSLDKRILPPNTASYFGIETIEGYDPIISLRYEELLSSIVRGKPDISAPFGFNRIVTLPSFGSSVLPILNVKYLLSLGDLSEPYLKKVFEEGETKVYEDRRALPRVWATERVRPAAGKAESVMILHTASDLRREAVVEGDISLLSVPTKSDEFALLTEYLPHRAQIETSFRVPRFLVFGTAYHPGWKALIDDTTAPIYRTNYIFQGVVVPEGKHRVVFSYIL
jgi:hypothetical protein